MFRQAWFAIGLLLVLLSASPVHAGQQGPEHTAPYWRVAYWNNVTLSGEPVLQGQHEQIDFAWGDGAPHPAVRADGFSVRWTRYVDVAAGSYRFTVTSDDGIRVYVDGAVVIDEWHDHPARTFVADLGLAAGHHLVTVEYYENTGHAVAKVSWEQVRPGSRSWRGEYFANRWLRGSPALVRDDASIDFAWGAGSPGAAIPSDGFSVRWTRTVDFEPGAYRFSATSDDGLRLSVDGRPVIDQWWDHPPRTATGYLRLTAGEHLVTVEYYENTGHATAKVWWETVPPQGWYGQYFDNRRLEKPAVRTRDDAVIDFNWGYGSPAPGVPNDGFSVRWMRAVSFREGQYRFTVSTDDGVRLWVNGHLLIDQWQDQSLRSHTGTIYLSGAAPLVMEYYENTGVAAARLTWERIDEDPPPPSPGDVIVDDADPGFVQGGAASAWRTVGEGYGGRLVWTWNNDRVRPNYNWGRWVPSLTPGRYEVYAYIPDRYTTTSRARYWISHRHGYTLQVVDQSANGGHWVSLGIYSFSGDRSDYVSLADVTFEPYVSRMIAFDAVKWVPRPL